MNKFFNLYNSLCTGANSSGVFSFDPYFSAVKEMLVSELREVVFYIEKLKELNFDMTEYTDKVIEFVSVLIVNLDFRRESFFVIVEDLYNNKSDLQNTYINICTDRGIKPESIAGEMTDLSNKESIIKALNEHEKNINLKGVSLGINKKNLYEIMINLVLNACNCLIELKNYGEDFKEAKEEVLKLFNSSNFTSSDENEWIKKIKEFSAWNYKITKKLYDKINERFGPAIKTEVPFIIKEGKAILVSGSSFLDLEKILIASQGKNINVYTHHNLISAFRYSKLNKYKNLVGHYQRLNNNFPLDFASFPGPIFITRNSAPKIEVIRGQIYTEAKYPAFGIAKIENNDFTSLIDYALNSDGFKENTVINTISIGMDEENLKNKIWQIVNKFQTNQIKHIAIIGIIDKFAKTNDYINKFLDEIPDDLYVISFAYDIDKENVWCANPYYDFPMLYKILDLLQTGINNINENISIFLTDCAVNTLSQIFNLKHLGIKNIFLGTCCPNIMNPVLFDGLKNLFGIKEISSSKTDIKLLLQ